MAVRTHPLTDPTTGKMTGTPPVQRSRSCNSTSGGSKHRRRLTRRQGQVLDALARLIATYGFRHLRVADIAELLGCSLTLLYGLARNREDLILVAIRRLFTEYETRMSAFDSEAHCLKLLAASAHDLAYVMVPPSRQFYIDVEATHSAKHLKDSFDERNLRRVEKVIGRGASRSEISPGDPLLAASIFTTVMIRATSGEFQSRAVLSRAQLVEETAELLLLAFRTAPADSRQALESQAARVG